MRDNGATPDDLGGVGRAGSGAGYSVGAGSGGFRWMQKGCVHLGRTEDWIGVTYAPYPIEEEKVPCARDIGGYCEYRIGVFSLSGRTDRQRNTEGISLMDHPHFGSMWRDRCRQLLTGECTRGVQKQVCIQNEKDENRFGVSGWVGGRTVRVRRKEEQTLSPGNPDHRSALRGSAARILVRESGTCAPWPFDRKGQ